MSDVTELRATSIVCNFTDGLLRPDSNIQYNVSDRRGRSDTFTFTFSHLADAKTGLKTFVFRKAFLAL